MVSIYDVGLCEILRHYINFMLTVEPMQGTPPRFSTGNLVHAYTNRLHARALVCFRDYYVGVVSECCCKDVYYRYPHNNYYFPLLHLY